MNPLSKICYFYYNVYYFILLFWFFMIYFSISLKIPSPSNFYLFICFFMLLYIMLYFNFIKLLSFFSMICLVSFSIRRRNYWFKAFFWYYFLNFSRYSSLIFYISAVAFFSSIYSELYPDMIYLNFIENYSSIAFFQAFI